MPAREWRGPGAADERARGRGRDRADVSVENWVQDFQQRRTFGKTNRYISPTSSAHVWVLRRTRARAVLAASVASPHLRPRDTHGRRSSSPVPCPHTRSSGRSALSTGGDRRLHGAWAAITTELLEAVRSQGPLAAALPRRASLVAARRVWEGQRRPRRVVAAVAHARRATAASPCAIARAAAASAPPGGVPGRPGAALDASLVGPPVPASAQGRRVGGVRRLMR